MADSPELPSSTVRAIPPAQRTLGAAAVSGAKVSMLGQAARIVLQLCSVVVLARLLSPSDYGLFAIVLLAVGVAEIFRDFGLSAAALQAPTLTGQQRDNLFWLNAALGLLLMLITIGIAAPFAHLFGQPALAPLLAVASGTFLLNGLAAQYKAGLNRDLKFSAVAFTEVITQAVGLVVAVALAAAGSGVWALVYQQLTVAACTFGFVAGFARWRPGRPARRVGTMQFLRFGRNMLLTQLVGYGTNNVDSLVLGLRIGPAELGLYSRAYQMLMRPLNQMRVPLSNVAISVLSRLQDDLQRSNEYIKKGQIVLGYTVAVALSLAAGSSAPLVAIMLGPQWAEVAPLLSILTIAGILQLPSLVGYWVYVSRGLTGHLFRYSLVTFVLQCVTVLLGSAWGTIGVAVGFATAAALEWPLSVWWLSRHTVIPVAALVAGTFRILAVAAVVGSVTFMTIELIVGPPLVELAAGGAAGVAALAFGAALAPPIRRDLQTVAATALRRVRRNRVG